MASCLACPSTVLIAAKLLCSIRCGLSHQHWIRMIRITTLYQASSPVNGSETKTADGQGRPTNRNRNGFKLWSSAIAGQLAWSRHFPTHNCYVITSLTVASLHKGHDWDGVGALFSALCLLHCLLLPLLVAALPALSIVADESVHRLLLVLLAPPLVLAMVRGQVLNRRRGAAALLLTGFALLLTGGFSGNESLELPLTILGGLVLITGHGLNAL